MRYVELARVPRERHQGVGTADPAQALADIAWSGAPDDRALRVLVDAVRWHLGWSAVRLVGRWKEIGHPGGRHLYAMKGAFAQESEGERDAFAALFADDPYPPDCQVVLLERLRVDFAYLYAGLFMEYLGEPHNTQVDADTTRTFALERPRYRGVGITKSMLRHADLVREHLHGLRLEREQLVGEGRLVLPPLPPQPPRLFPLRTLTPGG